MPYDLKGRNVLITGGSRGLGAAIVRQFAAEGCNVSINYVSNEAAAREVAEGIERQYGGGGGGGGEGGVRTFVVVQGDCGKTEDCKRVVQESIKALGGLDIVIGNAGWTKFAPFGDLDALSEEDWDKCWKVNVWGQMVVFREALPTLNANPDGGVFILTSSIAGTGATGSSMPYSISKCAQLHLMKCLAQTQGPKVRVNAVRPGLLLTDWGMKFPEETVKALKERAVLKSDTDIEECASSYIMIAKNTSMTGQSIGIDAGLQVLRL